MAAIAYLSDYELVLRGYAKLIKTRKIDPLNDQRKVEEPSIKQVKTTQVKKTVTVTKSEPVKEVCTEKNVALPTVAFDKLKGKTRDQALKLVSLSDWDSQSTVTKSEFELAFGKLSNEELMNLLYSIPEQVVIAKRGKTTYYQEKSLTNFQNMKKNKPATCDPRILKYWGKFKFDPVDMECELEITKKWTDIYTAYTVYGDQQYRLLDKSNQDAKVFEELKAKYIALEKNDASLWIQVNEKLISAIESCKNLEEHIEAHGKIIMLPSVKLSSLEMPEGKESSKDTRTVEQVADEEVFYEQRVGESRTQYKNRIKEYERTKREMEKEDPGDTLIGMIQLDPVLGDVTKKSTQREMRRNGVMTSIVGPNVRG